MFTHERTGPEQVYRRCQAQWALPRTTVKGCIVAVVVRLQGSAVTEHGSPEFHSTHNYLGI